MTQKNKIRNQVFKFYSIASPNNKNLLTSKTIFFEKKPNKKTIKNKKKLNNLSNDYDLLKNETQTYFTNNKVGVLSSRGEQFISGKLLKVKKVINNKRINENPEIKNKKAINLNNLLNKKKNNYLSYNKILLNGNTLINDKSNKLIKIQNKIFNINNNDKKNNVNIDKEKLILKINKELSKKKKKHSSIKNSKTLTDYNLIYDKKGEKKEMEISHDLINKLNQNIVESKMANNFILKLIKLYYESTGLIINKDNDLNSTLTILYNWIENINKKFYFENKKLNEELQYKILRQKIMNQYQLKNKKELKDFLFKILGND